MPPSRPPRATVRQPRRTPGSASAPAPAKAAIPAGLHPHNPHGGRYDLPQLVRAEATLAPFVRIAPHGGETIDFADAAAVKALNRALLRHHYGIAAWDLPPGRLCPSIPGRVDYLHHIADLLAGSPGEPLRSAPAAPAAQGLDVGTGASGIYALLGAAAFGWRMCASDIDAASLANVRQILAANPPLAARIDLRHQRTPGAIFAGIIRAGERFDFTVCNPPFHDAAATAAAASRRKWRQLGKGPAGSMPTLNFGGVDKELWCPGGEIAFILQMIRESRALAAQVRWFTTLVARAEHLPPLRAALRAAGVHDARVIDMRHGQKRSRVLAWTYLNGAQQADWRRAG